MDYTKILTDILAIDTSVPPGLNYDKVLNYLEPHFKSVGCTTERVVIPAEHADGTGGRVNLLAHRRAPGKPRLIFYEHVDVVPAQGWPAFTPRVEDGRIYGRGASDMKGSIAALLLALEKVAAKPLKYDVTAMITTDEETGQSQQLHYLAKYLEPLAGAYFFNMDASFGWVGIADLGALQLDIKVKGKSVHSAMSNLGENAVEQAALLVAALLKLKKRVAKRHSRVPVHPEVGIDKMQARLNLNMIHGGIKVNVVPDECVISVDRRLIPEENIEDARKELLATLSSVPGVNWEVASGLIIPTASIREDPIIDELASIIKEVTGSSGKYGQMGSGDLPHIVEGWGALIFGMGVIRADNNIHGKNEFVYQKDIEDAAEIVARFITA